MTASEPPLEPSNPPRITIFTNLQPPLSIELPAIEALLIKASPVDTNERAILVETNELEDPFTSTIEAPVIEAPVIEVPQIEAPPAIDAPAIEAPTIDPSVIEPPVIEAPVIELPVIEAPVIEPLAIEAPPAIEPPAIEALVIEAPVIEPPVIEALAIEALAIEAPVIEVPQTEALLIKASPVDTILVKTNEHAFTSIIDYCFARSSIPESLSTTTLTLPLFSIPATELGHSHSLQRTSGSLQRTNRITPTYTSEWAGVG
jgi:hypothetical protein